MPVVHLEHCVLGKCYYLYTFWLLQIQECENLMGQRDSIALADSLSKHKLCETTDEHLSGAHVTQNNPVVLEKRKYVLNDFISIKTNHHSEFKHTYNSGETAFDYNKKIFITNSWNCVTSRVS